MTDSDLRFMEKSKLIKWREDCEEELTRRDDDDKARLLARATPPKKVSPVVDWTRVVEVCERTIDDYASNGCSKDYSVHIAEAALEAVYGPDVHSWMDAVCDE